VSGKLGQWQLREIDVSDWLTGVGGLADWEHNIPSLTSYWHFPHGVRIGVYEMVWCPSVCFIHLLQQRAAGLQVGVDKRYRSIAAQLALHSMELQQQMWVAVPRFQHV